MPSTQTPADILRAETARDGSRPLLTFYDDATGERVELSVATFDNWVAKTAGLLQDGLAVEPGERVALLLPTHWQAAVWAMACWSVGACVVAGEPAEVAVAVSGPDDLQRATGSGARDIVALSLRPLGGRFPEPLPAGVLDYAVEVPSYPDRFVAIVPPDPSEPAFDDGGVVHTLSGLVSLARDRAASLGLPERGTRLLTTRSPAQLAGALDAVLLPLAGQASAVLVRNLDPARQPARVEQERVDLDLSVG